MRAVRRDPNNGFVLGDSSAVPRTSDVGETDADGEGLVNQGHRGGVKGPQAAAEAALVNGGSG